MSWIYRELAAEKNLDPDLCKLISKGAAGSSSVCEVTLLGVKLSLIHAAGDRTLSECFGIFALIHQVTTSVSAIQRITREVLEDCAADNIIFAELRTTPKVSK